MRAGNHPGGLWPRQIKGRMALVPRPAVRFGFAVGCYGAFKDAAPGQIAPASPKQRRHLVFEGLSARGLAAEFLIPTSESSASNHLRAVPIPGYRRPLPRGQQFSSGAWPTRFRSTTGGKKSVKSVTNGFVGVPACGSRRAGVIHPHRPRRPTFSLSRRPAA